MRVITPVMTTGLSGIDGFPITLRNNGIPLKSGNSSPIFVAMEGEFIIGSYGFTDQGMGHPQIIVKIAANLLTISPSQ
jgi:hypothetical protein